MTTTLKTLIAVLTVAAAFLRDFPLNDSVTIGVVTLQAKDTARYYGTLRDLKINETMLAHMRTRKNNNFTMISMPKSSDNIQEGHVEGWKYNVAICTPNDLTVSIYDVQNNIQDSILLECEINKITF